MFFFFHGLVIHSPPFFCFVSCDVFFFLSTLSHRIHSPPPFHGSAATGATGAAFSGWDRVTESPGANGLASLTPVDPDPIGASCGDTSPTVSRGALGARAGPGTWSVARLRGTSGRAKI